MDRGERRNLIGKILEEAKCPLKGGELAARMNVTRQIIVQDIALLRAGGMPIIATPEGYLWLEQVTPPAPVRVFACQHDTHLKTREELMIMVNAGAIVRDVLVEHPVYGEITGALWLRTADDVEVMMERLGRQGVQMLSTMTGGVHMHTVEAASEGILSSIERQLKEAAILMV